MVGLELTGLSEGGITAMHCRGERKQPFVIKEMAVQCDFAGKVMDKVQMV